MRMEFSTSGKPVLSTCKKNEMKVEYRLLNAIIAKALTAKARSFDAVTQSRFDLMVAIMGGVKINWSKILFRILKAMVIPSTKQAHIFVVQLSLLLERVPRLKLGDDK
ncbi:pentatricopeptide repeat-containing protein mitochondrial-like [Dorcoceras hygrometricum]|uniref:Pentatricopeptide repeat-containing protein mitochondrial-like n=1 Tax=Dorcoceras hygrometricum TaxID=472368 RepID=A0A2Z7BN60_9LAMI|nr:pentatricopeptide repeat-containing protein mitochondrial-like [Dorcoceras hygrometricum]